MDAVAKELSVFWRKFGRLTEAGVPLFRALDVLAQETSNEDLRQALARLHATIKEGGTMHEGLAKSPALFPLSVSTIVKAAEIAGRLEKGFFQIAEGIEDGSLLPKAAGGAGQADAKTAPAPTLTEPGQYEGDEAKVVVLANDIIRAGIDARASDIHVESTGDGLRIRHRVDGVLHEAGAVPPGLAGPLVSRLKIMADLNAAERRLPQDGRLRVRLEGKEFSARVSCVPCLDGENLVMRILAAPAEFPPLKAMGFTEPQLALLRSWLAKPFGMILIAGPTGSGKTTTIYSAIKEITRAELKIVTVEDPIELRLPGVSQLQVKPAQGLTFAVALRAFLRHDPDVMVAAEIRDIETLQVLLQAATTGHRVITTVHTEDSADAVQRLIDVGVAPFLVASALIGVVSQRLVRRVCPACKEEYQPEAGVLRSAALPAGARFWREKGCERCRQTGYLGRLAIHEFLEMNDVLRKAVREDAGPARYRELMKEAGQASLRDDGIAKAAAGLTALEEVFRVCSG